MVFLMRFGGCAARRFDLLDRGRLVAVRENRLLLASISSSVLQKSRSRRSTLAKEAGAQ
jgi:hypothetical protein